MLFVLTGPESSAKSSLTHALGAHFDVPAVGEVARQMLANVVRYAPSHLLQIAQRQQLAESALAEGFGFADTDLQVIYVWWQERFGPAPAHLAAAYAAQSTRHYLLCRPDIPWEDDPLRENPFDRERLLAIYQADLEARGLPYSIIQGHGEARLNAAIRAVKAVLAT
jgi:nicotinamide riboside kinase